MVRLEKPPLPKPPPAEVISVLGIDGERAVERPGPPCSGVPRLVRDAALDDALGSPLARDSARAALRARFGDVSEEEMGQKAAESGYRAHLLRRAVRIRPLPVKKLIRFRG